MIEIKDERLGPFKGQLLVGDFQNAVITRVQMEKVDGQWQGAVWPFLKGFQSGVTRMVTICTKLKNADSVRAISEPHDPVFWAVGTHPMIAADEPLASVEDLEALARHPKMVGIGEPGLD